MASLSATAPQEVATGSPPARGQPVELFAWTVVVYNVLVILWGALVRATGSGAGCGNHWPLCNGQVIPLSPRIDTVIEFTHRCMTGGATFAVLGLLLWTFRATRKRHPARIAAVIASVLLLNEAFLGALLVKLDYVTTNRSFGRVVVLSVHLSNTLLLLAALTMTAWLLGAGREHLRASAARVQLALAGLLATIVVGVSGSLAALGDTLFPSASLRDAVTQDLSRTAPMLIRIRWVHPVSAIVAGAFVFWLLRRVRETTGSRAAQWVAALLAAQFLLGIADVLLLAPVSLQIIHLLGADLFWIALVILAAEYVWPTGAVVISAPSTSSGRAIL